MSWNVLTIHRQRTKVNYSEHAYFIVKPMHVIMCMYMYMYIYVYTNM